MCLVKDTIRLIAGQVNECTSWTAWKTSDPLKKWVPCRIIGTQGRIKNTHHSVTTQKVDINLEGLECLNKKQIDEDCWDYEVRFCCKGEHTSLIN